VVSRIAKNFCTELAGRNCLQISGSAVLAPIGARTLRLQSHQPHGWSVPANIFQSWRGSREHWKNGISGD